MSFRKELLSYAKSAHGTDAEYPWEIAPGYAVLRHRNGKWYGVIMNIHPSKLGLKGDGYIDVMNVKCDPFLLSTFLSQNGKVDFAQVKFMLDMSYEIINKKKK